MLAISRVLRLSALGAGLALGLMAAISAGAVESEDADEMVRRMDQARLRLYLGGREEQDLTVQSSLPLPSRAPEGPTADAAEEGSEPPSAD